MVRQMHERWIHYVIVHLEVPLVCELKYIMMSNVRIYTFSVDATADNGRKGRLLNHSRTAANVVTRLAEVDGQPYLCLVAARDISVGEQLEYDYGERDRATMDSHPWLAS